MEGLRRVYARNCEARRIDKAASSAFLSEYHRLGATGGRYRYGLFISRRTGTAEATLAEGQLVAVAVFSNARRWLKEGRRISSYEWIRYACLPDLTIVGGMGKLLQTFISEVKPDDIMSYASFNDGGAVYSKLGFQLEEVIERDAFRSYKYRLVLNNADSAAKSL